MTTAEAIERQAAHENLLSCGIRQQTAKMITDVLTLAQEAGSMDLNTIEAWGKMGELKARASWALTHLQIDQRMYAQFWSV